MFVKHTYIQYIYKVIDVNSDLTVYREIHLCREIELYYVRLKRHLNRERRTRETVHST